MFAFRLRIILDNLLQDPITNRKEGIQMCDYDDSQRFTVTLSQNELKVLVELISAANNGRAKDFHGKDIGVGFDLYEQAMTEWMYMSNGWCHSCAREQMDCDHTIDEKGNCAKPEACFE